MHAGLPRQRPSVGFKFRTTAKMGCLVQWALPRKRAGHTIAAKRMFQMYMMRLCDMGAVEQVVDALGVQSVSGACSGRPLAVEKCKKVRALALSRNVAACKAHPTPSLLYHG
jgi:hypothetical protein